MRVRFTCCVLSTALIGFAAVASGEASVAPRHCVVWISPAGAGYSHASPMVCFTTFEQAQRAATGRPPGGPAGPTASDATAASTRISIDYDGAGFTGATLTWTVSNSSGCTGGFSYSAAGMPSGWNDRVSSSHSYGGCAVNNHYHDTNFLGAGITCTCSTMGTMTNQTSSETWDP